MASFNDRYTKEHTENIDYIAVSEASDRAWSDRVEIAWNHLRDLSNGLVTEEVVRTHMNVHDHRHLSRSATRAWTTTRDCGYWTPERFQRLISPAGRTRFWHDSLELLSEALCADREWLIFGEDYEYEKDYLESQRQKFGENSKEYTDSVRWNSITVECRENRPAEHMRDRYIVNNAVTTRDVLHHVTSHTHTVHACTHLYVHTIY